MASLNAHTYDEHIETTESNNIAISKKNVYSEEKTEEFEKWLDIEKNNTKKEQNNQVSKLMEKLNGYQYQEILKKLQKYAIEPIKWIKKIIPFK